MSRVVFEEPTVDFARGEHEDGEAVVSLVVKQRIMVDGKPLTQGGSVKLPCPARDVADAIHAAKMATVMLRQRGMGRDEYLATWPDPEREVLRAALDDDDPTCRRCGTKDGVTVCPEADLPFHCTNFPR